jgi:antirestriction protein ArdC
MASVYEIVTEQVIQALEQGIVPWRKPWCGGHGAPMNITGREYRGVNVLLLGLAQYASPYWLTYRQATERGGHVKKGEHGRLVVLWRWHKDETTGEETPTVRYYRVWSLEQCEGVASPATTTDRPFTPVEAAERILAGVPAGFAPIRHGASGACYVPDLDEIRLPVREAFHSEAEYYGTALHEAVHWPFFEARAAGRGGAGAVCLARVLGGGARGGGGGGVPHELGRAAARDP